MSDRRATRAFQARGNLGSPRWSPDGRWIAYMSDESGAPEVLVRRADGTGVAIPVSVAGGEFPRWRPDGRELYYRAPDGSVLGVGIALGETAVIAKPRVVAASPPFNLTTRQIQVSDDGQRFIGYGRGEPPVFTLLLDWTARAEKP